MPKLKLYTLAEIEKKHRGTSPFNDMMLDLSNKIEAEKTKIVKKEPTIKKKTFNSWINDELS